MTAAESGANMHNLTGWVAIGCTESDAIRATNCGVLSSLTDPAGNLGNPIVYTEWGDREGRPILRDYGETLPGSTCTHFVPEADR